ncbi:MAG: RNA polymerase sigma-70 factor [Bacteroidota bacterium]
MDFRTPEGFEQIYRLHWKKLFGICLYQVQDEELAKEIIQDIFKSLWERRSKLEINSSLEAYLIRAVKLEVMDYFRTKANHDQHLMHVVAETVHEEDTTEQTLDLQELNETMEVLIEQLPAQCKRVFELSRQVGLKNREIAAELLISEKAVEYHITKALNHLRSNLPAYRSA